MRRCQIDTDTDLKPKPQQKARLKREREELTRSADTPLQQTALRMEGAQRQGTATDQPTNKTNPQLRIASIRETPRSTRIPLAPPPPAPHSRAERKRTKGSAINPSSTRASRYADHTHPTVNTGAPPADQPLLRLQTTQLNPHPPRTSEAG